MLFLINNPVFGLIVLLIVVFTTFMIRKIWREVSWNRTLRHKQRLMRILAVEPIGFRQRIGLLTSAALAPVLLVALVLTVGFQAPATPAGDRHAITSAADILAIHERFETYLSTFEVFMGWRIVDGPVNDTTDDVTLSPTFGVPESSGDYTNNDGDQGSDDYSETNNQVVGVDEMDNVLTDGKHLYRIDENEVQIILAYTQGEGPSALSYDRTLTYEDSTDSMFRPTGLYVDEDHLIVIGYEYNAWFGDYYYYNGYESDVHVYVYDKHNDFAEVDTYILSGNLIGTRKIDNVLYLVTAEYLPFDEEDFNLDDHLPTITDGNERTTASYEDIVYVDGTMPNSFTTFHAIDLDTKETDMEVVLGDRGYNLYVSMNHMYLVGNLYHFEPIARFFDIEDPVAETKTGILKIAMDGADLSYVTTGQVPGVTLNQFSMDEYDGYLRIATTTGWWGNDINNRVLILDENLDEVSRIEHLGKEGETIKSVRFQGDYGYLVTFEQTDPFYVLNLADPSDPQTVGELEIPGFSSYLQPLGNDFMLGIGFGDNSGGTNGLKISIYDIRDKTNPTVFDEVIFDYSEFGWGSSSATYNHKDLLVSLAKGIIALPFSTNSWTPEGYRYNSGILVYRFDATTGLDYGGYIQHEQNAEENVYVYKIKFISDYFYSVSDQYVKSSSIANPETILGSVTLP